MKFIRTLDYYSGEVLAAIMETILANPEWFTYLLVHITFIFHDFVFTLYFLLGCTSTELFAIVYRAYSYLIKKEGDPMDVEGKSLSEQAASFFKLQPINATTFSTLGYLDLDDTPVAKWLKGKEKLFLAVEWLYTAQLIDEKEVQ